MWTIYQILKKNQKLKGGNNMITVLQKNKKEYTFRRILERSKMIGKTVRMSAHTHLQPKMQIAIAHLSHSKTSNKLLNTINQAQQQRIIHEFDIIKSELYKQKEVVKIKTQEH